MSTPNVTADSLTFVEKHLHFLLTSLDGVIQGARHHPEKDALYHSLQVFQLSYDSCDDPELWAAALLHDVGKAVNSASHATIGADELEGILTPRIVWLIRHHLHLLAAPQRTRRWLHQTPQLKDLELLRIWDTEGRSPHATVMSATEALDIVMAHAPVILYQPDMTAYYHNKPLLCHHVS
ncbi:MAG: HD domain-containing protein [Thiomargarita sp.]|nr:HD domain-containing protein [Thiomargarita sp.]